MQGPWPLRLVSMTALAVLARSPSSCWLQVIMVPVRWKFATLAENPRPYWMPAFLSGPVSTDG